MELQNWEYIFPASEFQISIFAHSKSSGDVGKGLVTKEGFQSGNLNLNSVPGRNFRNIIIFYGSGSLNFKRTFYL